MYRSRPRAEHPMTRAKPIWLCLFLLVLLSACARQETEPRGAKPDTVPDSMLARGGASDSAVMALTPTDTLTMVPGGQLSGSTHRRRSMAPVPRMRPFWSSLGGRGDSDVVSVVLDANARARVVGLTRERPGGVSLGAAVQQPGAVAAVGGGFVAAYAPLTPSGLLIVDS